MASVQEIPQEEEEQGLFLDRYIIERQLGEGSYGKVKLAIDNETNRRVALKVIHKSTIKKPEHITRIKREVRIMRLLNHPNIVKLYDVAETDKDIILAMEYVEGGELFDYIVAQNRLNDKTARRIFRQIVSAVDYCHQSSVIHRDLKPENLLMDNKRNIKIIDFGFVNLFDPEDTLKTFCGSPFYASPEMILGRQYVGPEVDVWSMGVILYALLTGQLPFRDVNTKDLYRKITTSTFDIPSYVPEDASILIRKMLSVDPNQRATLDYIRTHGWVNRGFDGPPESLIPWRCKLEEPFEDKILDTMRLYGYDSTSAKAAILANPERGPAFSLYWLLKEQEESVTLARQRSQYLNRHNSGAIGPGLVPPRTDSSGDLDAAKRHTIKRRKSISGAIRQNLVPARSTLAMPSTDEDVDDARPSQLKGRATSTLDNHIAPKEAKSMYLGSDQKSHNSRFSVNGSVQVVAPGVGNSEDLMVVPSTAIQRRRSISAVQTQFTPGSAGQSKLRRRMTEHNFNGGKKNSTLTIDGSHRTGVSTESSRRASLTSQDEDVVTPIPNISGPASIAPSNRSSFQRPSPSAIAPHSAISPSHQPHQDAHTSAPAPADAKPKRRISINLGSALSSAFNKLRPTSSHKRQDSATSASSTGSTAPKPRVSKSMYPADTTSSKTPDAIVQEMDRVFAQIGIKGTWTGYKVLCVGQNVEFQIEICQVKGTHMYGLELRRKKGSTWNYQEVCRNLIKNLKL